MKTNRPIMLKSDADEFLRELCADDEKMTGGQALIGLALAIATYLRIIVEQNEVKK